ncbi:PhoH family protein [uncultured Bacteroides sp.]|uniref:PhoH family protein n=1 Tax=uncultured Bacteroides sp. TaxID=162156 RepID=UPI002AABF0BB|nr:PhoH family protein [uncultured Bacteroides sp.]
MGTKKNFVLDTNVILHDYNCLKNFQENDIYLPIVVLEELDKFKKGNEQINFNAREFVRELDAITDDNLFSKGASLGEGLGKLFIMTANVEAERVKAAFTEHSPDHQILALAEFLEKKHPRIKTILVTKDVNLRMKARSIGVLCEDYITDKVINVDVFEQSNETFDAISPTLIDRIYTSKEGIDVDEFDFKAILRPNECFVLKSDRNTVLARYNPFTRTVDKVSKSKNYGIEPRNAEQSFAFEVLNDPKVKLVALTGKAGTGKTLLALAAALANLNEYKQVLLARPIVSLSNKDIGFLPGDAQEKVAPYMQPLFDNLNVIKHQFASNSPEVKRIEDMQKGDQLVIEALAFIRGRSLSDTYCIIDEAQNLTPHEIKTIITRAGEGTKMVFTGDIQQIDQPYLDSQSNGLVYMIDRMKDQNIFSHINLIKGERSQLSELASNLM